MNTKKTAHELLASLPRNGQQTPPNVIVRCPETCTILGHGKTLLYLKLNSKSAYYDSRMPRPVKIGQRAVGWYLSEVQDYVNALKKT